MKTACLFFVCFLAVALADHVEEEAKIAKAVAECNKDLGITESKDTGKSLDDDVSDEKKPCFYFCVLKKVGLMNENGTVNKPAIIALYDPPSEKERMEKDMENCEKTIKPIDGCKMANCLHSIAQRKPTPSN